MPGTSLHKTLRTHMWRQQQGGWGARLLLNHGSHCHLTHLGTSQFFPQRGSSFETAGCDFKITTYFSVASTFQTFRLPLWVIQSAAQICHLTSALSMGRIFQAGLIESLALQWFVLKGHNCCGKNDVTSNLSKSLWLKGIFPQDFFKEKF